MNALVEEGADVVGAPADRARRREPDVGDGPARDDRVERQDADAGQHPQPTEQPPPPAGGEGAERPDRAQPRAAADGDLAGHDRRADQEDARQVDHHERGPAALPDLGRKPPDVAQPDGRAGRRQDEAGARAPHAARRGRAHVGRSSVVGDVRSRPVLYPPAAPRPRSPPASRTADGRCGRRWTRTAGSSARSSMRVEPRGRCGRRVDCLDAPRHPGIRQADQASMCARCVSCRTPERGRPLTRAPPRTPRRCASPG